MIQRNRASRKGAKAQRMDFFAPLRLCVSFFLLFLGDSLSNAAEVSTNGSGGGPWSDPATWRGKTVPRPKDDVVLQKNDVVSFDRNDDGAISCQKLQIDPKGSLVFKTGAGKQICCVADTVECYGIIKLDGTKADGDFLELRMVGDSADKRKIKLARGANLLLYGKANLPDDKRNVALTSPKFSDRIDDLISFVEADGVVCIDWQRAMFHDVKLSAKNIDNTGAKANERLNVIENRFVGQSRLALKSCDTPVIARNTFEFKGAKPLDEPAINVSYSPLSEIKGNHIHGGFAIGISVTYQSDSVIAGNIIEKCPLGINGGYGIPSTMLKNCIIRGCDTGIKLEGASGVLEDTVVEGATTAFHIQNSNLQLTNFRVKDLAAKGIAVLFDTGTMTLLNCNIAPGQIKIGAQPPTAKGDLVTCLQYALIAVKDAPADCLVDVRTTTVAADASDPNVRNAPAPLTSGLTPLAKTVNPLIIKAWSIDLKGQLQAAPEYTVKVLGPAAKEGDARPLLKMTTFRPQESAFRAKLDDATPTLEVKLK
jgi:Right handed beta helix region